MNFWLKFRKDRLAAWSLAFLLLISIVAAAAPWVTSYSFEEQNVSARLQTPSVDHWMGTDALGRDLYSRIVYGARLSLSVGILTALIALGLGTLVGALAGYCGGLIDAVLMRVVDLFFIFPSLLLAILITLFLGHGFVGVLVAIGFTGWMSQARLVRAQILQARELAYVESARALGVSDLAIVVRHILPNLWGPIIVSLNFQIPANIMSESFLSFLGLGLEPPSSSWGTLANEGFHAIRSFPHLVVFPGAILFVTLVAFNYLGDGLTGALD